MDDKLSTIMLVIDDVVGTMQFSIKDQFRDELTICHPSKLTEEDRRDVQTNVILSPSDREYLLGMRLQKREVTREFYPSYVIGSKSETIFLPWGITIGVGPSGSGKTTLFNIIDAIQRSKASDSVSLIRFSEPEIDEYNLIAPLVRNDDLIKALLFDLTSNQKDVIILDSFRRLFYSSKSGATGKGGIDMTRFSELTHLSIVANMLGKSMLIGVNPISKSEEVMDQFLEASSGSVQATLHCISPGEVEFAARNTGRVSRKMRVNKNLLKTTLAGLRRATSEELFSGLDTNGDDILDTSKINAGWLTPDQRQRRDEKLASNIESRPDYTNKSKTGIADLKIRGVIPDVL